MAYIKRPQRGEKVLQSLFDSVNSIIDYLPTITVRGDNYSTYVEHSSIGTVIHAKQPNDTNQAGGKNNYYYAGKGIHLVSGNVFENALSGDGTTVVINNNVISAIGGGGGGGGPDHDTTYTGEYNATGSGWISVDASGGNPHIISSSLRWIKQLYNDQITSGDHFLQTSDIKEGAGTTVNFHYSSKGDHTIDGGGPDTLIKWIDGIEVDLNVSGGTYITTNFYKGVGYGDYTSASINCNLFGTYDWYPHTSGFIAIVPQYDASQNITGGIISTNLHAGSGIAIDPSTGEITATGGGGGGGGGDCHWPNYDNLDETSGTLVYPLMRYTTSTGGWIRISLKSGTGRCVGIWVDDNYVGLGMGIMTWTLAIPPGHSFYVDVDWNMNNYVWFDSTVTPSTTTREEMNYWLQPPMWEENRAAIISAKELLDSARDRERSCYNYMTGALGNLNGMINDWREYEYEVQTNPDAEPESLYWYEEQVNAITGKYDDCQWPLGEAVSISQQGATVNNSLPNPNPMYTYQFTDIPAKSRQYYDQIGQYITSAQYYYDLAAAYWNSRQ